MLNKLLQPLYNTSTFLINHVLALDPETRTCLNQLHGQIIQISLQDLSLNFYFSFQESNLVIDNKANKNSDVIISGNTKSILILLKNVNAGKLYFNDGITIQGNVEIIQKLNQILHKLSIDWEEFFARYLGDQLARVAGNFLRETIAWSNKTLNVMQMNVREYMQEEIKLTPGKAECEDFFADIDELTIDFDRTMARFDRLLARMQVAY